jgi:hypothetical protein
VKKYKIAAILLIIHGGLFEIAGLLAIIPIIILGNTSVEIAKYISFIGWVYYLISLKNTRGVSRNKLPRGNTGNMQG